MTERSRANKGCFEAKNDFIYKSNDVRFKRCLGIYKDPSFPFIMQMHDQMNKGHNPFGVSYESTPNKFIEVCNLIDNLIEKKRKQMQEQAAKEVRRNGK